MSIEEINQEITELSKSIQVFEKAGFYNTVSSLVEQRNNLIVKRNKI